VACPLLPGHVAAAVIGPMVTLLTATTGVLGLLLAGLLTTALPALLTALVAPVLSGIVHGTYSGGCPIAP
jgi:hypothetical protein